MIVPTTYAHTPAERYREAGVSLAIEGNQTLRASIKAMRAVAQRMARDEGIAGVQGELASVRDVFALTNDAELREAERHYLTAVAPRARDRAGGVAWRGAGRAYA